MTSSLFGRQEVQYPKPDKNVTNVKPKEIAIRKSRRKVEDNTLGKKRDTVKQERCK